MGDDGKPRVKARTRLPAQFVDLVIGKAGQDRLVPGHGKGAAAGDLDGVLHRLGQVREQNGHVAGGLEVVLRGQAAAGTRLVHHRPFADADQRVVGAEHLGLGKIHVVGGDQRQAQVIGDVDHRPLGRGLGRDRLAIVLHVALEFNVKAVAEDRVQRGRMGAGVIQLARRRQLPQGAGRPAGQADQPGGVAGKFVHCDMRRVLDRGDVKARGKRHQVHPPALVLREQHHRPAGRARIQRDLAPDDGLHALVHRLDRKLQRREQGVGVGQRDGGHPFGGGEGRKLLDRDRAFQQRVLGMAAKMDELGGGVGHGPEHSRAARARNRQFGRLGGNGGMTGSPTGFAAALLAAAFLLQNAAEVRGGGPDLPAPVAARLPD